MKKYTNIKQGEYKAPNKTPLKYSSNQTVFKKSTCFLKNFKMKST